MTYVLALLAAIAGCVIGGGPGGLLAGMLLAPAFGITSFEGASARSRSSPWSDRRSGRIPAGPSLTLRARERSFGLMLVDSRSLGPGLARDRRRPPAINHPRATTSSTLNAAPARIAFEIRLPPDATLSSRNDRGVELRTTRSQMPPNAVRVSQDGGRTLIAGDVDMYFRVPNRLLAVTLADGTDVLFRLKLAAKPAHSKQFGPWERAELIEPKDRTATPPPTDPYEIRYRAAWPGQD